LVTPPVSRTQKRHKMALAVSCHAKRLVGEPADKPYAEEDFIYTKGKPACET
ncbi:24976_t:CDS:1, partial [Dentiscutata erythropus]